MAGTSRLTRSTTVREEITLRFGRTGHLVPGWRPRRSETGSRQRSAAALCALRALQNQRVDTWADCADKLVLLASAFALWRAFCAVWGAFGETRRCPTAMIAVVRTDDSGRYTIN
jgi:hypothetical protein